jgi:tetratricopeptide (TPR) repeat protein
VSVAALSLVLLTAVTPAAVSPPDVGQRAEELWKRRDDPAAAAEATRLLDEALAGAPNDYGLLWRAAAWQFWKSDDPSLPDEQRAKFGKVGWDLAERAVAQRPGDVAGHFWAAVNMGNYSLGLGVVRALAQGIEGKFRKQLSEAERLDPRYAKGGIFNAWGRFYLVLPWPKRDVKKAGENLRKALEVNPDNLRARVFLAQLALREDQPSEAKRLLDEVLQAVPGKYDAPEERRAKVMAAATMRKVVDAMK